MSPMIQLALMIADDLRTEGKTLEEALAVLSKHVEGGLPQECETAVRSHWARTPGDCCSGRAGA